MGNALASSALRHYRGASSAAATTGASPHKLIEMLYARALEHLAGARGSALRGETAARLRQVNAALAIVEHLRLTLDFGAGGGIAQNLAKLYDYMQHRLTLANAGADPQAIDEVIGLMNTLKSAWDALPQRLERH